MISTTPLLGRSPCLAAAAALALSLFSTGCDRAKRAELDAAWYDARLAAEVAPAAQAYSLAQLPPRPPGNPEPMTLSLWLKPLYVDRPPAPAGREPHEALQGPILRGLALDNLPAPLAPGAPEVRLASALQREGYVEARLQITDAHLGAWTATLLVPAAQKGPRPAVLALHGHGQTGADLIEAGDLASVARAGVVVLAPDQRAMGCDKDENDATTALYEKGLTLMGARVREAQTMMAYLAERPGVDKARLALVGHEAGAAVALLTARVGPAPAALVIDHRIGFDNQTCGPRHIHCETLPPLLDDAVHINHLASLPTPHLLVAEGLESSAGQQASLNFLKAQLSLP